MKKNENFPPIGLKKNRHLLKMNQQRQRQRKKKSVSVFLVNIRNYKATNLIYFKEGPATASSVTGSSKESEEETEEASTQSEKFEAKNTDKSNFKIHFCTGHLCFVVLQKRARQSRQLQR